MARKLDRIWIRFGLAVSVTMTLMLAVLAGTQVMFWKIEHREFQQSLPVEVRAELDDLTARGLEDGPRAMQIYGEYWAVDPMRGEKLALLFTVLLGLPLGLASGFFISKVITLPLDSMAAAATRVALGDFTVRAHVGKARGEMAEMVRDFNHMIDSLETLDREQRVTLASISHELRTPIAVLSARLHAICDGVIPVSDEEMRGLLDQSLHLGRLVADLHTLSLASVGRLSLQTRPVDLVALVGDALTSFEARLAEKGFEVDTQLPASAQGKLIMADPDRLRQIFANLVENALRHAASGRWIGVEVRIHAGQAVLAVSDAGPGLPASMRDRPFERFPHQPSAMHGGSGLGLSIVHALVDQQGGSVLADRSVRGGMRIQVCFPVISRDAKASAGRRQASLA